MIGVCTAYGENQRKNGVERSIAPSINLTASSASASVR
jgi:hypothetical protein